MLESDRPQQGGRREAALSEGCLSAVDYTPGEAQVRSTQSKDDARDHNKSRIDMIYQRPVQAGTIGALCLCSSLQLATKRPLPQGQERQTATFQFAHSDIARNRHHPSRKIKKRFEEADGNLTLNVANQTKKVSQIMLHEDGTTPTTELITCKTYSTLNAPYDMTKLSKDDLLTLFVMRCT
eukprot:6440125-Amphidinium_carterae.1